MKFKRQELLCEYIHLGNGQKVRKGSGVFDGGNKKSSPKGVHEKFGAEAAELSRKRKKC